MLKASLVLAVLVLAGTGSIAAADTAGSIFESPHAAKPANEIDRLVFARLAESKIEPVLCSDAVFVRRVYLDVIGTLPTAQEARAFIEDTDANKRSALIDRLLERDEFADYWSMKWGDILRIKAEFPVNLWPNAAQAYHRWLRASIAENKPYDKFVREMLTSSGSNFRVPPVNFYRAIQNRTPEGITGAVALAFMGARVDSWPPERVANMTVFFSQIGYKPTREWKEEHVIWNPMGFKDATTEAEKKADAEANPPPSDAPTEEPAKAEPAEPHSPPTSGVLPDGSKVELGLNHDPREVFADWLISPKNPWFSRSIVNRVWGWLLGRGIIHEPDDIRDDNPPSNPELLAYLEKEFVAHGYDLKHLYRLILNSSTYQLSSMSHVEAPPAQFARYPLRRLEAEVLIDAVNSITGTTDLYTSPIPEPFTYIPQNKPAIAIADGSITSSFLALFGRSARATGMENERDNKPVPAQSLHMLNSSHIQRKLDQGAKFLALIDPTRKQNEIIDDVYLTILSRLPTAEERKHAEEYAAPGVSRRAGGTRPREDWIDIAWALINSTEFLYRH
jgi:hypothetical protein